MDIETRERRLNENDRRKINKPISFDRRINKRRINERIPSFWLRLLGLGDMCRKSSVCPNFERRNKNGVDGSCKNCEYLKKERRQLNTLRVFSIFCFVSFLASTYVVFT